MSQFSKNILTNLLPVSSSVTECDSLPYFTTITCFALSPDSSVIFTGHSENFNFNIAQRDIKNQKYIKLYTGHSSRIVDISISSDGKLMVSASEDVHTKLRLWNVNTGECLTRFSNTNERMGLNTFPNKVIFSPTHSDIFCCSNNSPILRWNIRTREWDIDQMLYGHTMEVNDIKALGSKLFSSSKDGTIRLWDIEKNCVKNSYVAIGNIISVTCIDVGQIMVAGSLAAGSLAAGSLAAGSLAAEGLVAGGSDGNVIVWNIETAKIISVLDGFSLGSVNSVALQGDKVLVGYENGLLRLWDIPTKEYMDIKKYNKPVTHATFSSDGSLVFSLCKDDDTISIWKLDIGK